MGDKAATVPPYEANPSSFPQHAPMHTADSYGSAPGQPMVQHDIYQGQTQQPVSPVQTGTTTNNYPNQPPGSPPPQQNALYGQPQQPMAQPHPQPMNSPPPLDHPKGDFYSSAQQVPMQQVQSQQMQPQQMQPVQVQQSQYHTAYPIANLQRTAMPVDCPVCQRRALTRTECHAGNTTHAWALAVCCVFWLGCIPYLIDSLKDVDHKCGNCGVALATWHRSGHTEVHAHA